MPWTAISTEDFGNWFAALSELEKEIVEACIRMLEAKGDSLSLPLVSAVEESRHPSMRELRPQGTDFRILFAFTPWLILLVGADQPSWRDWTALLIPLADDLYDEV